MVNFHVWTLVWILVLLNVSSMIADAGNHKHRAQHRHGHHRSHHRKYSKRNSRPVETTHSGDYTTKINMTRTNSPTTRSPNETLYTLSLSITDYPNNDKSQSSTNFSTSQNTTYPEFEKFSSVSSNPLETSNSTNVIPENYVENSQTIVTNSIEVSRHEDTSNGRYITDVTDETSTILGVVSSSGNRSEEEPRRFPNDLEKLFGSTLNRAVAPKISMEPPPTVQLIRRKRCVSSEQGGSDIAKTGEPTLLYFNGPAIGNDPEEIADRESPRSIHVRVKRDGEESDNFSRDSDYLRDLANSFALSAREIDAVSFERSPSLTRRKRKAKADNNRRYDSGDASVELKTSESANSIPKEENEAATIEHSRDAPNSNPLTDGRNPGEEIIGNFQNSSSYLVDARESANSSFSLDTSTSLQAGENLLWSSESSSANSSVGMDEEKPITGYRIEDPENRDKPNFDLSSSASVENSETRTAEHESEVGSSRIDSSLKDDNSGIENRLEDVYRIDAQDLNQSALVQHVRTKRFDDGIVDPEASYANEAANSRIDDEPYAEDNTAIDSMLSKIDYRDPDELHRSARSIDEDEASPNDEEIYMLKNNWSPSRTIRRAFLKKGNGRGGSERRNLKKRRKSHKSRAKKHHRPKYKHSKIKRDSEKLAERINYASVNKFQGGNHRDDRKLDTAEQQVISPHDGRRRRENVFENDGSFVAETNEGRNLEAIEGRNLGDFGDMGKISEASYNGDASRNAVARSKLSEETNVRIKRDNTLREFKYFQNIREADGGENRSGNSLSDGASKTIREIRMLAEELVAKANELQNCNNIASDNDGTQQSGTSSRIVERTGDGSNVEKSASVSASSPRSDATANIERRSEACRKYPGQPESSEANGKSVRNSRGQCCSKKVRRKRTSRRKWDRWTDWSSCSVTCGRGRQIRWRHCIRNCSTAETEMEEKACQLPACAPGKFLGIFG